MKYIAPKAALSSFTCPHCGSYAYQRWQKSSWNLGTQYGGSAAVQNELEVSTCDACGDHTFWIAKKMVHPDNGIAPMPNTDISESVKKIYMEAAAIASKSPRGAAALLRLAIQMLCKDLGQKGENINADIATLVKEGLPARVQQALDVVRVTGNNAVHPGQIITDEPDVVAKLFELVNIIAEYQISMPARIEKAYGELPPNAIEQINKRDGKM